MPRGIEPDLHDGCAYVAATGTTYITAYRGRCLPSQLCDLSLTLQAYVRSNTGPTPRPGAIIITALTSSRIAAALLRCHYHEPWHIRPIGYYRNPDTHVFRFRYGRHWHHMKTARQTDWRPPQDFAAFALNHDAIFTRRRDGRITLRHAHHPPSNVKTGADRDLLTDAPIFGPLVLDLRRPPDFQFVAEGSAIACEPSAYLS